MTVGIIMSLSKALLSTVLAATCQLSCGAEPIFCPRTVVEKSAIKPLQRADVFDGPPTEMVSQIPDLETLEWDLAPSQAEAKLRNRPFYLVCRYKNTKRTITFKLPYDIKSCQIDGIKGRIVVVCQ